MEGPVRRQQISELTERRSLGYLLHPIEWVTREPVLSAGFTSARHEIIDAIEHSGVHHRYRLKVIDLNQDWTALRTQDAVGREAAIFSETSLQPITRIVGSPVVAYAVEGSRIGLLMVDLTGQLFPDVREPLSEADETALLETLATLHAHFWNSRALGTPWLAKPHHYPGMLDATVSGDAVAFETLPPALHDAVPRGWNSALRALSAPAAKWMRVPARELTDRWSNLPRTLVHGDAKVANFARNPMGGHLAFDWAIMGAAPCSVDLGWYLAVNATRLAGTKEATAAKYRGLLEGKLGTPLANEVWAKLWDAAVLCGARMLLWSKALARESGTPQAQAEWSWWAERLDAIPL